MDFVVEGNFITHMMLQKTEKDTRHHKGGDGSLACHPPAEGKHFPYLKMQLCLCHHALTLIISTYNYANRTNHYKKRHIRDILGRMKFFSVLLMTLL